jgi:hypothetical protein
MKRCQKRNQKSYHEEGQKKKDKKNNDGCCQNTSQKIGKPTNLNVFGSEKTGGP